MATDQDTAIETHERPGAIIEALRQAGVDRELTMRVFDCIETERAQAISKAARLFYRPADERGAITLGEFSDGLNNMTRLGAGCGDRTYFGRPRRFREQWSSAACT
jgi:hypothetical protein